MYLDNHFRHLDLAAAIVQDCAVAGLDHAPAMTANNRDAAP